MKIDLIGYPYNWLYGKCADLRRKPRRSYKACLYLCVSIAVEYAMKYMGVVKNNDR